MILTVSLILTLTLSLSPPLSLCVFLLLVFSSAARPFPILLRLLRVVSVLVRHYHVVLAHDCEILMSMLQRMLEHDSTISFSSSSLLSPYFLFLFC